MISIAICLVAIAAPPQRIVGRLPGGAPFELAIVGDRFVAPSPGDTIRELGGRYVVPAFIDSHVHLAYLPRAADLAKAGVAGVVDLASPLAFDRAAARPLTLAWSGPMLTARGGYPTQDWGHDGYGLECDDAKSAAAAVDRLRDLGATLIKVAITGPPALDDAQLTAIVARAHARGMKVAAHALTDRDVLRAAAAQVDILAHTPVTPLSEAAVRAFADRTVISTLAAFGGSPAAIENLRRLRKAGARVLYGTDLGNTRDVRIQEVEIALMIRAGMDGRAILDAGTRAPAVMWSFDGLGVLAPGKKASFLVLAKDPIVDPTVLSNPAMVWIDGALR